MGLWPGGGAFSVPVPSRHCKGRCSRGNGNLAHANSRAERDTMTGKASGHIDHEAAQTVPHANPDTLEVAPGTAHEQLEGWIPQLATDDEIRVALEKAFDYRGDVTITRKDGSKIEGYLFDRRTGATLRDSLVRLYPKDSNQKLSISYADIAALAFTGRDTAAGKSWEAWMKKYAEKKAAGEKDLSLHPESLE